MTINDLIKEKRKNSDSIRNLYLLPPKNKPIGVIKLEDKKMLKKLLVWLSELPSNFVVIWEEKDFDKYENIAFSKNVDKLEYWFDFLVCDKSEKKLNNYFWKWVVPITPKASILSPILKEFNPLKNEWNSYLYENTNYFSIFYAIIRYLENYKFPFDNKNLVKNVYEI